MKLDDVKPITKISEQLAAVLFVLDKQHLSNTFTLSTSINSLELLVPKIMQQNRRGNNALNVAISDNIQYLKEEDIVDELENSHKSRSNAKLKDIPFLPCM